MTAVVTRNLPGGKTINSLGLVVVPNMLQLPPTPAVSPDHEREITSYRGLLFGETLGPWTQIKLAVVAAGTQHSGGWFRLHDHPEPQPMDEAFLVASGEMKFRLVLPDGSEEIVWLGQYGMIVIPPTIRHEGWNDGDEPAVMFVVGNRTGFVHPCDEGKKGTAIPTAV